MLFLQSWPEDDYSENSLCARILKAKYFHNKDPLSDEITTQGSWIWKSIYKGLQIVKKYYVWSVGNGAKIKIWKHNWIPSINHTQLTNASQHNGENDIVQSLIQTSSKQWNIQSINQKFSHTESRKIQEIRIPTNASDSINWILTNGTFTVKSTYNALVQEFNGDNISSEAQKLWLKIWHLKLPYKLNFFLWRCLKDILQTTNKAGRYIPIEDYSCPFCKQEPETDIYLFLHCDMAQVIWFTILPEAMHSFHHFRSLQYWIKSLSQEQNNISFKKEKSILLYTVIMWQIWKSRCLTVFEGKNFHPNNIIITIRNFCTKHNILGRENHNTSTHQGRINKKTWEKPP
ncbi:hypothetical protein MKW92_000645 [Papaver armeniacum]|nr:hypothetical protein MKW92_000645 [Papaver armeniacum]